jgi:transcription termination/antitermination protein NusG
MSPATDENESLGLKPGMTVRILEGPFKDFRGIITEINPNSLRLKTKVNFFGKEIDATFNYSQVVPEKSV